MQRVNLDREPILSISVIERITCKDANNYLVQENPNLIILLKLKKHSLEPNHETGCNCNGAATIIIDNLISDRYKATDLPTTFATEI